MFTAEGLSYSEYATACWMLQWGRGCSPRKVEILARCSGDIGCASMGPRLFTAEGVALATIQRP